MRREARKRSVGDFDQTWDCWEETKRELELCRAALCCCAFFFFPHCTYKRPAITFWVIITPYCMYLIRFLKIASCPLCVPQQGTRARPRTDRRRRPPAISASSGLSVTWMQRMYGELRKIIKKDHIIAELYICDWQCCFTHLCQNV